MKVYCKDFSQLKCPIFLDGEDASVCEQLSMHLVGSHGMKVSAGTISAFYKSSPKEQTGKEKVAKIETITNLEKTYGEPKKKTKRAAKDKWWLKK